MAGISALALGRLAGLSTATVGVIESGERKDPAGTTVARLAEVLGVSCDFLIAGLGPEPTVEQVQAAVEAARARLVEPSPHDSGEHAAVEPPSSTGTEHG